MKATVEEKTKSRSLYCTKHGGETWVRPPRTPPYQEKSGSSNGDGEPHSLPAGRYRKWTEEEERERREVNRRGREDQNRRGRVERYR
jgi:hypothetical protein